MADTKHPEGKAPNWAGGKAVNPGGLTRSDNAARRKIGEALRELVTAEELGRALLAIAAGEDPFESRRGKKKPSDGMPTIAGDPLRWEHRMMALKLFLEYHSGKPVQGVHVEAQVEQRIQVEGHVTTGPIDFRSMPPEVRAALRLAAAAALGRPLQPRAPGLATAPARIIDVHVDSEQCVTERANGPSVCLDDALDTDLDGLRLENRSSDEIPLENRPRSALGLAIEQPVNLVTHEPTLDVPAPSVNGVRLNFVGSSNLVDAVLNELGVLTVRFRAPDGMPARIYRYRNVTVEMMSAWETAPSAGAWFAREIRARHQQYPVIPGRMPGAVL